MSKKLKGKLKIAFLLAVTLSGSMPAMANDLAADNGAEPATNVAVENKWSNLPDFSEDERITKIMGMSKSITGFSSAENHPELLQALIEVNGQANDIRGTHYDIPPIIFTDMVDSFSYSAHSDVMAVNIGALSEVSPMEIKAIMAHELGHRVDFLETVDMADILQTPRERVTSIMLDFNMEACSFQDKMEVNREMRTGLDFGGYEKSGNKLHPFHAVGLKPAEMQEKLEARGIDKDCAAHTAAEFDKEVDKHQDLEHRADAFAVEIGYGEEFKKHLEIDDGYIIDPVYFSTHPTDEERVERIEKQLEQQKETASAQGSDKTSKIEAQFDYGSYVMTRQSFYGLDNVNMTGLNTELSSTKEVHKQLHASQEKSAIKTDTVAKTAVKKPAVQTVTV